MPHAQRFANCLAEMKNSDFILENRHRRVEDVALEISRRPDLDAPFILRQIEGWQRMRAKVPRWTEVESIHFPPRLALEQCSGQPAAEYKASVISRLLQSMKEGGTDESVETTMADLTGGMGVDFSFIAPLFTKSTYIEQREELVEAARHNLPLLGLGDAEILHGNGIDLLNKLSKQTLLFMDPARRDAHGGKTVFIEDCEPNVVYLLPQLLEKSEWLVIKLSTMLDIHRAITTLESTVPHSVQEVHVFSSGGECKDLLFVLRRLEKSEPEAEPEIYCADEHGAFSFTFEEENEVICTYPEELEGYLYEPGPSIMKAGAYKTIAHKYGVQKIETNSHLYISVAFIEDFPGRSFKIEKVYGFSKADIKMLATDLKSEGGKANLAIRNFPSTVADLRKKLKIKEGGNLYLFATTDAKNKKIIVSSKKV